MIYLPEYHQFEYIALVPWPQQPALIQTDWVDTINTVEQWLEQYTGPHWVEWAFGTCQQQEYWQACVAFRRERNKTLFLLAWA
jgi:hypothetical protein